MWVSGCSDWGRVVFNLLVGSCLLLFCFVLRMSFAWSLRLASILQPDTGVTGVSHWALLSDCVRNVGHRLCRSIPNTMKTHLFKNLN